MLRERRAELTTVMRRETGFTTTDVHDEFERAMVTLQLCAEESTRLGGEVIPLGASAGFEQVEVEPTRIYRVEDAREFLAREGLDVDALAPQVDGKFMSAFIRAVKPSSSRDKACSGPGCCN